MFLKAKHIFSSTTLFIILYFTETLHRRAVRLDIAFPPQLEVIPEADFKLISCWLSGFVPA